MKQQHELQSSKQKATFDETSCQMNKCDRNKCMSRADGHYSECHCGWCASSIFSFRNCEVWSSVTQGVLDDLAKDRRELCPSEPIWCIRGRFCPVPLSATPRHADTPPTPTRLLCTLDGCECLSGAAPTVLSIAITSHCTPRPNIPCNCQWQQGQALPASNCLNCLRQAGKVGKALRSKTQNISKPSCSMTYWSLHIWCKKKVRKSGHGKVQNVDLVNL